VSLSTASWRGRILKSRITENIAALFGTQVAAYIFPLATVPYLARVLGPQNWGMVAFAQALGLYLSMVVDFGFQLSATRRIARVRDDQEQVVGVVSGVLGAKGILSLACIIVLFLLQRFSQVFQQDSFILWAGAISGIGQGFSMLWFYQGLERIRPAAAVDATGKAAACVGIFLCVHRPADGWKVLALQCLCFWSVAAFQMGMTYRQVAFRWPTAQLTRLSMRDSAAMFLFRSSVSLYTTANALILGAIAAPLAVGFYSGAERVIKALSNLVTPVSQSLFPRISRLVATDAKRAIWLTRVSLGVMTLCGALLCGVVFAAAPLIVRILLGHGYENAIPVLRILSLLLPITAVSTVLGIQWMLPLGMDGVYNVIVISAGLLNVGLAVLWASQFQQTGMAWAVVVTESMVTLAVAAVLAMRNMSPLSNSAALPLEIAERFARAN
jgi:PST family polysaccharide transporter